MQLEEAVDCTQCPGGRYCTQEGLSAPEGDCNGGYYCILGADRPSPTDGVTGDICPTGAYCPPGSNDTTLCPPGTYNPTQGEIKQFFSAQYYNNKGNYDH